jgi:peroxiredoxin Q/BCP
MMVKSEGTRSGAGKAAAAKNAASKAEGSASAAGEATAGRAAAASSKNGQKLSEGSKAPDFTLPDDKGGTASLADFAGKKLVLYFYPKDDTSGCTKEAIDFNALRPEIEAAGAAILGVSPDSVASHAKFKAKHNLTFPLVSDEAKSMLEAYGVWVEKSMYGRKYMGVERTTFLIGPDGTILRAWNKVKVPGHAEAVLAAVKSAQKFGTRGFPLV